MRDYATLDLSRLCNAGVSVMGTRPAPELGPQNFHGIPFQVGGQRKRCFIALGGKRRGRAAVTIPIGTTVRHVLVAHALLESRLADGEPVGRVIAHYRFLYADGGALAVPIRERLEIGVAPTIWGQWPLLAMPDQRASGYPRHAGPWGEAGYRQTEGKQARARHYYLWVWENPHPKRKLASLELVPSDRRFLVAAITLGHADESPFYREASRPVRITLKRPRAAPRPFDLAVDVDRGVATDAQPLPAGSAAAFLKDPRPGWGEPANAAVSPAYVHIAAVPSATVTVKQGGRRVAAVSWRKLEREGRVQTPQASIELVEHGKNWVHVTVVDDASGKPVPCRVHFRSPAGVPYQPHGHHNHVNSNHDTWHVDIGGDVRLGQITYAYIDGTCQGWLPRGEVLVDVARGFEYEPLRARVTIVPGQRALTLRLKRWTDMNARGWFSGDTHVHFLGTQGAHCEAQGEDLNVVNLLQSQWGGLFTNTEDWTGRPSVGADGRTIVYCSQENRQHILGHLSLLGLTKPVMPWCTDGLSEAEMGGGLDTTLAHWADACHAQGGTVIIPHLPHPNGEPAALIATGRADAVEMIDFKRYEHLEYYRYLNGGYRLPLVGGTDKMSSSVPVGLYRTYAHLPDGELTYANWLAAVRAGRTFLSSGPMIALTVNGVHLGDTLHLRGKGGTVEVEARAESALPIHQLELVQAGRVVAATSERRGARALALKTKLKIDRHTWLAARCGGPGYRRVPHHDCWERGAFAHSSPIYVAVGGEWRMFSRETVQYMLTLVDGNLAYLRHHAPRPRPGTVTHHHGAADHLDFLEGPFLQARQALHRRLHAAGIPH
ncbi:MAG: CehA/McbA family metallohydrolase [Lentisphaerae bacterium]|nr:CehA/McbA family metallohydrolase [Lentisphaerota bacterium]